MRKAGAGQEHDSQSVTGAGSSLDEQVLASGAEPQRRASLGFTGSP